MSGTVLAGVLLAASGLLVVGGVAKAVRPADTARALAVAGLPVGPGGVRAVAGIEALIGSAAAVAGGPVLDGAVGVSYLVFGVFVAVALTKRWPLATCGCFGEPDAPPTTLHVVVDAGFGVAAFLAAVGGGRSPLALAVRRPGWGTGFVGVAAVIAGLAYLVLARLPKLLVETR